MSLDYADEIERLIKFDIHPDTTALFVHSEENRFLIHFHINNKLGNVEFEIYGSEARVICNLRIDQLVHSIRERVLAIVAYDFKKIINYQNSEYNFILWHGKRHFQNIPQYNELLGKTNLLLELSSKPCLINSSSLAATEILKLYNSFVRWLNLNIFEERSGENDLIPEEEGNECFIYSSRYERSKINRDICIKHYGWTCQICSINMQDIYGERAKEFIHVHHIERLADSGARVLDPINDLIPICPNCHSIVHRTTPPALPEEIKKIILNH